MPASDCWSERPESTPGEQGALSVLMSRIAWFIVAKNDKAIAPDLERFEAKRARSHTIEINSSHVAMMSHPDAVTEQITAAAHRTAGQ